MPVAFVLPSWTKPKRFTTISSNMVPCRVSTTMRLLLARVLPVVYRSGRHLQAFDERRDAVAPVQAEGHPPAQP